MTLTTDDVRHLASLARLHLTNEELEHYGQQMASILDYVSQLQAVDTSDVQEAITARGNGRRDDVKQEVIQEEILQNAPERLDRFVRVKAVFDHD